MSCSTRSRRSLLGLFMLSALPLGCVAFTPTPLSPLNVDDPPALSPWNRSLSTPSRTPLPTTPATPTPIFPDSGAPGGGTPSLTEPLDSTPRPPSGPELPPRPVVEPRDRATDDGLQLEVDVARQKQVGSGATFRLTLHNVGAAAAENVVLETDFDDPLIFPGRPEKKVRRSIGTLAAGETREILLTLVSRDIGQGCARFSVIVNGMERVWKSVCVDFIKRQLNVNLDGPTESRFGGRAEFTLSLVNVTENVLQETHVRLTYGNVLSPKSGSAGAVRKPGSIDWDLGELQPGERVQLEVEFECQAVTDQTCLEIQISSDGVPDEHLEACLEITAR